MNFYKLLSRLNDVKAAQRAVRTSSAAPLVKRAARKRVYRAEGATTRKVMRKFGL